MHNKEITAKNLSYPTSTHYFVCLFVLRVNQELRKTIPFIKLSKNKNCTCQNIVSVFYTSLG